MNCNTTHYRANSSSVPGDPTAHRLSTILEARQIVVLERGEIKEVGTHRELFEKSGYYRRLYDLQFNRHPGAEVPLEEMQGA